MSSECRCHTNEFCFYCEVYSPVVAERDRLRTVINIVLNKVEEAHNLLEEDSFENDDEAISILAESMRLMSKELEGAEPDV